MDTDQSNVIVFTMQLASCSFEDRRTLSMFHIDPLSGVAADWFGSSEDGVGSEMIFFNPSGVMSSHCANACNSHVKAYESLHRFQRCGFAVHHDSLKDDRT